MRVVIDMLDGFCNTYRFFFKVDILPLKSKDLTLAKPGKQGDKWEEPWVIRVENLLLVGGCRRWSRGALLCFWNFYGGTWIKNDVTVKNGAVKNLIYDDPVICYCFLREVFKRKLFVKSKYITRIYFFYAFIAECVYGSLKTGAISAKRLRRELGLGLFPPKFGDLAEGSAVFGFFGVFENLLIYLALGEAVEEYALAGAAVGDRFLISSVGAGFKFFSGHNVPPKFGIDFLARRMYNIGVST